jgi:hypothetical protein
MQTILGATALRVTLQNGVESLALTAIANQLVNRPDMIGQFGRHRWRAGQSRMYMAEVVHAASPEQGRFQALDIGGVDAAQFHLRLLHDRFGAHQAARRQPPRDTDQALTDALLDDLDNVQLSAVQVNDILKNLWSAPPNTLVAYFRNRFYEGQETPVYQIWGELRKLCDDFREQGDLFRVINPGKLKQDDTPQQSIPQPGQEP